MKPQSWLGKIVTGLKIWLKAIVIFLAVIFVIFLVNYTRDFFRVDKCLDNGGAWDYQNDKCNTSNTQTTQLANDAIAL